MTPENLVYWLSGFMERGGVANWGDASAACVRKHADVVLLDHPNDIAAMTVKALAVHPGALSDWLKAAVVQVTSKIEEGPDLANELRKAMDEARVHRGMTSTHMPAGWPVLFC